MRDMWLLSSSCRDAAGTPALRPLAGGSLARLQPDQPGCSTTGRSTTGRATTGRIGTTRPHRHVAEHVGDEEHDHVHVGGTRDTTRTIELQQKVLAKNDELADANRQWLKDRGVLAVNLMSSPGSGKTTLLERTSRELAGKVSISVIEGDQETALDANRILAAGSRVVQINTGIGCHLDAEMVAVGLRSP